MSDEFYDGTPKQAGPRSTMLTGRVSDHSITGVREAAVIGIYYPDEEGNISRTSVEYTLRDLVSGQYYYGAVRTSEMAGMEDGDESVLQVATKDADGGKFNLNTPMAKIDGDRVLVGFVSGSSSRPVIFGVLPHPRMKYGTKKEDGKRRFMVHAKTSLEIKEDGTIVVTRKTDDGDTTITVQKNGDVDIEHYKGAKLSLDQDVCKVDGKASSGILLGFNAQQAAVHGDDAQSYVFKPLQIAATTLLTAATAAPAAVDPVSAATANALKAALIAFATQVQSAAGAFQATLSQKVKLE